MTTSELKNKIIKLWKAVTPNVNDALLNLIMESHFNPEFVAYDLQGQELISAIVGVPFCFGNAEKQLKGIQFLMLATHPSSQRNGKMSALLNAMNLRAKSQGFAFSFVIPGRTGLQRFFADRSYVNAFFQVIDNYTSIHNFDKEFESFLEEQKEKVANLKKRFFDSLRVLTLPSVSPSESDIEKIYSLVKKIEDNQEDLRIIHSLDNFKSVIKANSIAGGRIFYVVNSSDEVTAAAFVGLRDRVTLYVEKMYYDDASSRIKLLSGIKRAFPEAALEVAVPVADMDRKALWSRAYGSVLPDAPGVPAISVSECVYSLAAHAKAYGMARVLDLSEILKFMAADRHDLKYSILVKDDFDGILRKYKIAKGQLSVEVISPEKIATLPEVTRGEVLTLVDAAEIIFRRRDADNLITEAFGIPSINASADLLLL